MNAWCKTALALALALTTVLAVGCRRRHDPIEHPGRLSRYEHHLIRLAARDSGCAPVQVQTARIAERVWSASTCTGPREYFLHCRETRRRWASCSWLRVPTVNESAANLLACPPPAIGVQPGPSATTRFASGCGRSVPMVLGCNVVGCGWVAGGPATGAPPAPATPPPGYGTGNPNVIVVPAQ